MINVMEKAYTEVYEILNFIPREYYEKIPEKLRESFRINRVEDYVVKIDPSKSINEQNFTYETSVILTFLRLNYWCKNDDEKRILEEKLDENDKIFNSKYDISALNSNSSASNGMFESLKEKQSNKELTTVSKKENWFIKIIRKLFKNK